MYDRAVRLEEFGGPEVLHVVERPLAEPGPGQVRIRVEAASIQFTDTVIRRGFYPDLRERPPLVPGYDLVGRVDAVGPRVSDVSVGSRVADLTMIGAYARYAIRPAAGLVSVPEDVDAAQATTLILSWVTAQQAVFGQGALQNHERLLVVGGTGAVGLAAITLATAAGIAVYATASERHHDHLRALGATPLSRSGWDADIAAIGGVDVVLDGVAADGFRSSYRALRKGGRLVGIGTAGASGPLAAIVAFVRLMVLYPWLPDGRRSGLYSIGRDRKRDPGAFRRDLEGLFRLLEQGTISPEIAEELALDQVAEAHARLEAGGIRGKLVLRPWAS